VDRRQRRAAAGEFGLGRLAQIGPGIRPGAGAGGGLARDEGEVRCQCAAPGRGQAPVGAPQALEGLGELEAVAAHLVLGRGVTLAEPHRDPVREGEGDRAVAGVVGADRAGGIRGR